MSTFNYAFSDLTRKVDEIARLRNASKGNYEKEAEAFKEAIRPKQKVEQAPVEKKQKKEFLTKRPFRAKMRHLAPDWPDKIWESIKKQNGGTGASFMPAVATLALTGMRPASLARGVVYSIVKDKDGAEYLQAHFKGAKILKNEDGPGNKRGQDWIKIQWKLDPREPSHRQQEFDFILAAVQSSPDKTYTVTHGTEVISNQLRDLSKKLWPRRKTLVSAVCYREHFSSVAKAAGVDREELAMAMGHLSEEAAGAYQRRPRGGSIGPRPFSRAFAKQQPKAQKEASVKHLKKVKKERSPAKPGR